MDFGIFWSELFEDVGYDDGFDIGVVVTFIFKDGCFDFFKLLQWSCWGCINGSPGEDVNKLFLTFFAIDIDDIFLLLFDVILKFFLEFGAESVGWREQYNLVLYLCVLVHSLFSC